MPNSSKRTTSRTSPSSPRKAAPRGRAKRGRATRGAKPVLAAPIGGPRLTAGLDLRSLAVARRQLAGLAVAPVEMHEALDAVLARSPDEAVVLSSALLDKALARPELEGRGRALLRWAGTKSPTEGRIVSKGFLAAGMHIQLLNGVGELPRVEARPLMKGFFEAGGTTGQVADWLATMGRELRTRRGEKLSATDGFFDFVDDVVDAVGGAATTVWDAVTDAGKSLADMVSDAVSWTVSKVTDLVEALVEAGQSVAQILAEAAKKGGATLRKFAAAVIKSGQTVAAVLAWAAGKAAATINDVVRGILDAGQKVAALVTEVAKLAEQATRDVVKALLAIGRSVAEILDPITTLAAAYARRVVDALIKAGKTLVVVAQQALGRAAAVVTATFRALAELGHELATMLAEAARKAAAIVKAAVTGLLAAGKRVADLVLKALEVAANTAKKIVQALIAAGRKVGEILTAVVSQTARAIQTVLEGLLAISATFLNDVVKAIFFDVAAAFRRGFLEGLLAIGKLPLEIFKAALRAGGSALGLALTAFFELWGGYRPLTAQERAEAVKVFGVSIDLDRVRVAVATAPLEVIGWLNDQRPFTTMYIINFPTADRLDLATIIHELTHVWQGVVAGPVYMVEALHSQFFGKGYDVSRADLDAAGGNLRKLEREQQAVVVEWYWMAKFNNQAQDVLSTSGFTVADLEPLALDVFTARTLSIPFGVLVPTVLRTQPIAVSLAGPASVRGIRAKGVRKAKATGVRKGGVRKTPAIVPDVET